jgi:hypothetical protein
MDGDFPLEPVRLKVSGERVSCSPRQALEWDWGYSTARTLYAEKGNVENRVKNQGENFPLIIDICTHIFSKARAKLGKIC